MDLLETSFPPFASELEARCPRTPERHRAPFRCSRTGYRGDWCLGTPFHCAYENRQPNVGAL